MGYIVASGIWKKREDGVVVHRWCDPSRADSLFVDITRLFAWRFLIKNPVMRMRFYNYPDKILCKLEVHIPSPSSSTLSNHPIFSSHGNLPPLLFPIIIKSLLFPLLPSPYSSRHTIYPHLLRLKPLSLPSSSLYTFSISSISKRRYATSHPSSLKIC